MRLNPGMFCGASPARPEGTVRYVDSSVERLQVRARGFNPERYVVSCNGHRFAHQWPGHGGRACCRGAGTVPGSRPRCLHPTIPVDAPLMFDLIDTWNGSAVGGCVYHVAHPGGRSYATFPVNAYEAESRRLARFFAFGHTPGKLASLPRVNEQPEFPLHARLAQAAGGVREWQTPK